MTVGIYSYQVLPALADRLVVATPTEIKISLGNTANELKFFPDRVQLVAGKKYKLLLSNSSPQKHYFTAMEFASSSWTQKVDAGNVEIKGAIQELELRPSANAGWVLVPMKPGNYQLHCTIPGHTAAGMTGTIAVTLNRSTQYLADGICDPKYDYFLAILVLLGHRISRFSASWSAR